MRQLTRLLRYVLPFGLQLLPGVLLLAAVGFLEAFRLVLVKPIFDRVLNRLTFPGALFLAAVAVAPSIFIAQFHFSQATYRALGGTSVLIVVGVALQTMRQMESQMVMRHYEGFLR